MNGSISNTSGPMTCQMTPAAVQAPTPAVAATRGSSNRLLDIFMNVPNMQQCEAIFTRYMRDEHQMDVSTDVVLLRRTLFHIMQELCVRHASDATPGNSSNCNDNNTVVDLKKLNNLTLNRARDSFLKRRQLSRAARCAQQERPSTKSMTTPPPMRASGDCRPALQSLQIPCVRAPDAAAAVPPCRIPEANDVQAVHRAGMDDLRRFAAHVQQQQQQRVLPQDNVILRREDPTPVIHHVMLTGVDREWGTDTKRFSFSVDVGGFKPGALQSTFRNVVALAVQCVILPMDVTRPSPLQLQSLAAQQPQSVLPSFAYPYLILHIDDLNVYEGMNDAVRGAFAVLRFDSSYTGANGRGYVVLVPMQAEAKVFATPLASLNHLRVSLSRPNGMLVSNAVDAYKLSRVEYDASFASSLWVKLVTNEHFDRQEFTGGDCVYLRNCSIVLGPAHASKQTAADNLAAFLNRAEGHEVVQIGQANDKGFYMTFYVLAPGALDAEVGKVVLDAGLIELIQVISSDASGASFIVGDIINATLQLSAALKITTLQ